MQTTTGETSISNETSFNASRETSLTALGFLDYLDEEQRAALLGEGLDISTLTRANQVTALRVLESLFNEHAYELVSAVIQHVAQEPGDNPHHFLKFSPEPSTENAWEMTLDGPTVGIKVTFDPDGQITFKDAHLGLSPAEVVSVTEALDTSYTESKIKKAAEQLVGSLNPTQQAALQGSGLRGAQLTEEQKTLFLKMTSNWIDLANGDSGSEQQEEIADTFSDTYIIWNEQKDGSAFFQMKGPELDFSYKESVPENAELSAQGVPNIQTSFQAP
ncbi:DUF3500 domain-containing protein [Corynebacterium glutamicum]|uniref:DUF3500 domain-containing protein n=1 Tax=Corynebacterium glutamicum TaxID=1718 RepID=UPI000744A93E|nr:DUF3500 domain-containing protein [Corynebacterium glutamicum]ALZ99429.1 hypothetical protein APT58_03875 [Corynebacterium glutamicum]